VTIFLACTWQIRGEMARFQRTLPHLRQVYGGIAISLPPDTYGDHVSELKETIGDSLVVTRDWSHGRHAAIQKALEYAWSHVHYADMDRFLHWVETEPAEWLRAVQAIQEVDCLVIGRTERAWDSHPEAMRQTEAIVNAVASYLLGQRLDTGAGSKGFSRRAAEFLMANSPPGRAIGTDTEWPVLLQRSGFQIAELSVDGLAWEHADHFADHVADTARQRQLAAAYDEDARNWEWRVQIALEIVEAGLDAARQNGVGLDTHEAF
jgi:hypothetical protein